MTDMTAVEILREARGLIADPCCWTRGWFAHDESGHGVDPGSRKARRWCATGACMAADSRHWPEASRALDDAAVRAGYKFATDFNDAPGRTHAEVLALYDEAIQAAEKDRA